MNATDQTTETSIAELTEAPIFLPSLPDDGALLHNHPDGQVRITGTRISLEIFLSAYQMGITTPEQLAQRFDTVSAHDAEKVLAYYQDNRDEVDEYLRLSNERQEAVRNLIASKNEPIQGNRQLQKRFQDNAPFPN